MEARRTTTATVSSASVDTRAYLICFVVWSNFEIADLNFWRSEAYSKYFDFLDSKGGFYYEVSTCAVSVRPEIYQGLSQRWGDAPVHSIGAALFAKKDQIHFFENVGYRHEPFEHCPTGRIHSQNKCWCDEANTFGRSELTAVYNQLTPIRQPRSRPVLLLVPI
jgi:hypothetical protein